MSLLNDEKFENLSQDLVVYMSYLHETHFNIEESEEKMIIQEWIHLILEKFQEDLTLTSARIRNMALSQMLLNIETNSLRYPFHERPSQRSYAELIDQLMSILNNNIPSDDKDPIGDLVVNKEPENNEMSLKDYEHLMSADNRTYIAIKTLPNNSGVFGYIAITMGDEEDTPQWLNSKGCPIVTPVPSITNLPVLQAKNHYQAPVNIQHNIKKVWHILKNRKSLCLRNDSLNFFKMLYENVEQEMLDIKNTNECNHPFIKKLLKFLELDLKAIGITDLKIFCRLKMLSILKKQIKSVIIEIEQRAETLETAAIVSTVSPIISLPPKCCYNFVTSTLWNELSQQRPGTKYMDILSHKYPKYFFPKYFAVLVQQKKQMLTSIAGKYCKILDEMFVDLGKVIMTNMKKYKNAKWEWHLAHEIIDAYNKEKAIKDSLCATEHSSDQNSDSLITTILNEIEMAQNKLQFLVEKKNQLAEHIREIRIDIGDREQIHKTIVKQYEDEVNKYQKEINIEKHDAMKRQATIIELKSRIEESC